MSEVYTFPCRLEPCSTSSIVVLGDPAEDLEIVPDEMIALDPDRVVFRTGSQVFEIALHERVADDKWNAEFDPDCFSRPGVAVIRKNGGGVRNTAVHLAQLKKDNQLEYQLQALVGFRPTASLRAEFGRLEIQHHSFELQETPVNLVLPFMGKKHIFRMPFHPQEPSPEQRAWLRAAVWDASRVLVNSPKSMSLTRDLVQAARASDAALYAVVNKALPRPLRLAWLVPAMSGCMCNYAEFYDLLEGIGYPQNRTTDELTANPAAVGRDLVEFSRYCQTQGKPTGDWVVTLGPAGAVAAGMSADVLDGFGQFILKTLEEVELKWPNASPRSSGTPIVRDLPHPAHHAQGE